MSEVGTKFSRVDMHVDTLPPLELDPEEATQMGLVEEAGAAGGTSEVESTPAEDPEFVPVEPETVRNMLELGFTGGYLLFRHEHWNKDKDEDLQEELDMLTPRGVKWLEARPRLAAAVNKADAESFPVLLSYSVGKRVRKSIQLRRQEREEMLDAGFSGESDFQD